MFKCEKHILNFTTLKNNIFFTSDTHFGHANIIKYAYRPYTDVDEMNKFLLVNQLLNLLALDNFEVMLK